MAFLSGLGNFLHDVGSSATEQIGSGENTSRTLDAPDPNDPNKTVAFGSLGEFASRIDASAQRSYVESGYTSNVKPKSFEAILQEPDTTVLVKKRMFSSLSNNFKVDKMDGGDLNFYKAAKRLFQSKCQAISVYEKLSKIDRAIQNKGALDDYFVPLLVSGINALSALGVNIVDPKTKDALDEVRKLLAFSEPLNYTTWLVDPNVPFDFGEGTGVFELTLVSGFSTTTSVKLGGGQGSLTIEDPYHLFNINEQDIDRAISDVYNPAKASQLFQFSEEELSKQNTRLFNELNSLRRQRGASPIVIRTSDESILYKRVSAFFDLSGIEIIFNYNPGVFGIGSDIDFDPSVGDGPNGLTETEQDLLSDLLNNTYTLLNLRRNQERDLNIQSIDDGTSEGYKLKNEIKYVREKMRLNFMNKNIIQSMDSIHIFVSSKTQVDNKILGVDAATVTSPGNNILTQLNTSINNLEQSFNNLKGFFGGSDRASYVEIEKAAIVGPDFPTWLWTAMRNDFTRQGAGTQVFCGIVDNVTENYSASSGKYTLNVTMKDNSDYFRKGITNINPSVDVRDREIYDPLTPFNLEFDASSGFLVGETPELLQENIDLLQSGDVKFKNGSKFIGSPMTKFLYGIGDFSRKDDKAPRNLQKIFYDPDGFVYRWKSGIGTYTFSGPRHPSNFIREDASVSLNKNPFAGQDIMNVLSLLISGIPYNYNTFVTSAIKSGNLLFNNNNPDNSQGLDNVDIARSFFRGFISDLQLDNLTWGNFIPFKKLVVSEKGLNFLISGQFSIQKNNAEIGRLLDKRSKIFDTLTAVDSNFANNVNLFNTGSNGELTTASQSASNAANPLGVAANAAVKTALDKIEQLDADINNQLTMLNVSLGTANTNDGQFKIFGDDMSFDPTYSEIGDTSSEEERQRARLNLRRKLKFLTQRRLWKVKANQDINLLIVDDQYDKDYDIQGFEQGLAEKMEIFKSDYANIFEKIDTVASILGLEVFADTQGHINIKPPGYNKMPSSVFYRMISDGKEMYPKQLQSLFLNQADSLIDTLEIVEDEIRLRTTALGFGTDDAAAKFLSGSSFSRSKGDVTGAMFTFAFLTSSQGNFGSTSYPIRSLVQQSLPDNREDIEKRPLKQEVTRIAGQLNKTALFDTNAQVKAAFDKSVVNTIDVNSDRYDQIRDRLRFKKGQSVPTIQELFSTVRGNNLNIRTQTDVININKQLSQFISERQRILKTLHNAIKNIDEGMVVNQDEKAGKSALFPSLYRKQSIPSVLEHMIEDEEEDDLGPGSGGRYIIKENQIISMSFGEKQPDFTAIEVNGLFGDGFVQPPNNLNVGSSGNAVTSAIAVDYDMWRMYGFKMGSPKTAPFISDPDGQAAPLATWMLNEQRRKILSGTITIVGNEYMQPGEVIYIEDRDLLFYVEDVNHSFNYGSDFKTTLTITYGHNPGEYFPTMLDVVGKGLYSKRNSANLIRHVRQGNSQGYEHLGTLMVENFNSFLGADPLDRLVSGKYGDKNRKVLTNLLISLKASENQDVVTTVEIRIYKNSLKASPDASVTQSLSEVGDQVKVWLKDPTKRNFGPSSTGDSLGQANSGGPFSFNQPSVGPQNQQEGLKLDIDIDNVVQVIEIDTDDYRSPSGEAILYARQSLSGTPSTTSMNPDAILGQAAGLSANNSSAATSEMARGEDITTQANGRATPATTVSAASKALYSSILDIWVSFKPATKVIETNKRTNMAAGQAANEAAAAVSAAEANKQNPTS